jgi:tellurite resistance protein/predicted transcriptional regulator
LWLGLQAKKLRLATKLRCLAQIHCHRFAYIILKSARGSIMSTRIDNFTKQLHDNLEAVENRAKSLKESIQSAMKKTQAEIQSKLDEAKAQLDAKKQEFDEYRARLKTQFEEKESEVESNIEEWRASREVKKLEHRADKAEDYAATAILLAMAMMEEAEKATLEAIAARLDAEAAAGTTEK